MSAKEYDAAYKAGVDSGRIKVFSFKYPADGGKPVASLVRRGSSVEQKNAKKNRVSQQRRSDDGLSRSEKKVEAGHEKKVLAVGVIDGARVVAKSVTSRGDPQPQLLGERRAVHYDAGYSVDAAYEPVGLGPPVASLPSEEIRGTPGLCSHRSDSCCGSTCDDDCQVRPVADRGSKAPMDDVVIMAQSAALGDLSKSQREMAQYSVPGQVLHESLSSVARSGVNRVMKPVASAFFDGEIPESCELKCKPCGPSSSCNCTCSALAVMKRSDVRLEHKETRLEYLMELELYNFFEITFNRVPTFTDLSAHWPSMDVLSEFNGVTVRFEMAVTYQCAPCEDASTYGGSMPKRDLQAHADGGCVKSNAGEMERLRKKFNASLRDTFRMRNAWNACRDENILPID